MHRLVKAAACVAAVTAIAVVASTTAMGGKGEVKVLRASAQGTLKAPQAKVGGVTKTFPTISDSTIVAAKAAIGAQDDRLEASDAQAGTALGLPDLGQTQSTIGCNGRQSLTNVRVNQDCTFRRQAEEEITVNPADPQNLIAGQNDSRVGFNQCGIDFSTDGGRHWGDMLPPFRQRFNDPAGDLTTPANKVNSISGDHGTLHTYDAASDPAVAVDSAGRAFFSCVVFDVNSNASGVFVTGSPAGAQGSFYSNVPSTGKAFMVVEDNGVTAFHDKEFIAADAFAGSPNRDNVYVTWTVFQSDKLGNFSQSPIYGSMSTDHAVTWSAPEQISGANPAVCNFGDTFDKKLNPNSCNFDQGSDPVVMPNGDLVVVFNNTNTPTVDAQQLAVHCSPSGSSTAGTAHFNCRAPSKVGDEVITGEPFCDFGRGPEQCVPGAFIRTNGFPRVALGKSGKLYTVWQDGRSGELDIQMATSSDGGATWSSTRQVNPDTGLDHYMPAVDVGQANGQDRVAVSYYRNERVPNEGTVPPDGFTPGRDPGTGALNADYVLAGAQDLTKPFAFTVLSPVFGAPNNPAQVGFNGDYSGIVVSGGITAHPIWSDTRNHDPFLAGSPNEEDVFTDGVSVPKGPGTPSTGVLGQS
ncbi:MAG TPA: hypothetical protein VKD47_03275 [Miltoncostaeaceae bacterium]|nr:hypothetical protein [Miltoncostaeaceae bacterium]